MNDGTNGQLRVLLFIEGDETQASMLKTQLEQKGCSVESFTNYSNALRWINHRNPTPHAVIIDMPDIDFSERPSALKLYQWVREGGSLASQPEHFRGWNIPILMLVPSRSRHTGQNFDALATELINDYEIVPSFLPKPASGDVIHSQILGLQRVHEDTHDDDKNGASEPIAIGNLIIWPRFRRITVDSREIELEPLEYDFLEYFILHRGDGIRTHEEVLKNVWRIDKPTQKERQFVTIYKRKITEKFQETSYPEPLKNKWGEGYYFNFPQDEKPTKSDVDPNGTNPTPIGEHPSLFANGYLLFDTDKPSSGGENDYDYLKEISGMLPLGNPGMKGVKLGRGYKPEEPEYGAIDLIIDDNRLSRVSRDHATIFMKEDGHYYICDNGSSGHTFIIRKEEEREGKRRVHPGKGNEQRLLHGDRVCFNVVEYRFEMR